MMGMSAACGSVEQTGSFPTIEAPTVTPIIVAPSFPTPAPSPQNTGSPLLPPTPQGGTVPSDPTLVKFIDEAKADLTTRANVSLAAIALKRAEAVEWRDSSLGCPMPGMMYAQVITPGYLIVLEADGKEWNYHASETRVMWCDK
jgi:hypothetical protein